MKAHSRLALRLAPFVALVYLQLLVATDTERLLALAAIPVAWLALCVLRDASTRARLPAPSLLVLPFALLAGQLMDRDRYALPFWTEVAAVLAALSVLTLVAVIDRKRNRRDANALQPAHQPRRP